MESTNSAAKIVSGTKVSPYFPVLNASILHETMAFSSYSRLAEISLYFEKTWTEERILSIEDCLDLVDEEDREELFGLLLEIDITKGFVAHAVIPMQTYKTRFPKWLDTIEETFAQFNQQSITGYGRLGTKIAHYHIQEVLGKGAMGIVFKATDELLLRTVAVKYILPQKNRNPEAQKKMIELFCNEVAMMGQLKRDTMFVQAYDSNWDGDFLYLAMEYVDGDDLAKYVRKNGGKLLFHEALGYIRQIAEGLCEIHDLGIIHRDIKPENVVRSQDGTIRILDLGLGVFKDSRAAAKLLEQVNGTENSLNNSALILDTESKQAAAAGTPAYWSPEAYHTPEAVDARSDLFSLGGTFFFLLTGILPVKWRNPIEKREKEGQISLKDFLESQNVHIPSEGLAILEKLLELNPDDRFASAYKLLTVLRELEEKFTPKPWYVRWKKYLHAAAVTTLVGTSLWLFNIYSEAQVHHHKMETAQLMIKNQKPASALNLLIDMKPEDFKKKEQIAFLELRSSLFISQGQNKEYLMSAQKDFEKLISMCPENLKYRNQYIHLLLDLGDLKKARDSAIQIQKNFPRDWEFKILDAEILITEAETVNLTETQKAFNLSEALDILTEALGQKPSWEAFYWRAKTYHALNDIEFAMLDLKELMKINRDIPAAWLLKADLHMAEKNYLKALECWDYLIRRKATFSQRKWADIYLKQAQAFFRLNKYNDCIKACTNSEINDPITSSQLLQMRAESAFFTTQWEMAVRDFRNLFSKNVDTIFSSNEQITYYTMFAFSLLQIGKTEKNPKHQEESLKECLAIVDLCKTRFPDEKEILNLQDVYLKANLLLGNTEDGRHGAQALFDEMLKNSETASNATVN